MSNEMNWKPVSEYTEQPSGTFLVLWDCANNGGAWPICVSVYDNHDGVDELLFENGYEMLTDEWDTITHFAVISSPDGAE